MTVLVSTHYMDEAERCHEIAYIAYGELLAQGTIPRGDRGLALAHLHGERARPQSVLPRSSSACPVSTWSLPSAPICTSLAATRAALDATVAEITRHDPELEWAPRRALARGRVHRPDGALAGQLPMIAHCNHGAGPARSSRTRGDVHQGVRAAAARPADVRHDDLHPARAAHAVRLRHQHHAAASADRGARLRGHAMSGAPSSRRCATPPISSS